jgi:carbamate kinase
MGRSSVIAVGGNVLIREGQQGTIEQQLENARATAGPIAALVADGWHVVVTHGNGPQVGFNLLRSELASDSGAIPKLPLYICGADSQGSIGHILGTALATELAQVGIGDRTVCVLTHTVVAANDPAFQQPNKPVGPWFTEEQAAIKRQQAGWDMVEDAGRGYRRVVASPQPLRIVETSPIRSLLEAGLVVLAVGGGGIPVVERAPGVYKGVDAVIDKDLASVVLATALNIPTLIISTGVDRVAINFRQSGQRFLEQLTVSEARAHLRAGQFLAGSMGPKIRAAIRFLEHGGHEVLITSPHRLLAAVAGTCGTRVVPDSHGNE